MHGLGEVAPQDDSDALALQKRAHHERFGLVTPAHFFEARDRFRFSGRSLAKWNDPGSPCHDDDASTALYRMAFETLRDASASLTLNP